MKRSELKADPQRVIEWQRRTRRALSPGKRKRRKRIPAGVRARVFARRDGWCPMCLHLAGHNTLPDAPSCALLASEGRLRRGTQIHHILPVERFPELELEVANMLGTCVWCHENHTNAARRFPRAIFPCGLAMLTGPAYPNLLAAVAYLNRTYPT